MLRPRFFRIVKQKGAAFQKESCAGRVAEAITSWAGEGWRRAALPVAPAQSLQWGREYSNILPLRSPGYANTGAAKDKDGAVAPSTQVGDVRHVESPIGPTYGEFLPKAQRDSPGSPNPASCRSMPLAVGKTPHPWPWGVVLSRGQNRPSLLVGSGHIALPLPHTAAPPQHKNHPLKRILVLKAKTLYAIA